MVLRRLAVAAEGCDLRAAEAICAEADLDLASPLSRLVERSLVRVAAGPDRPASQGQPYGQRNRLLESVAAYGMQRLRQAGEYAQGRRRHRQFYADLAERAASRLRGYDQRSWLWCLDTETANLRTALDAATHDGDASAALRMANALAWYWLLSGRLAEARRTLDEALALSGGSAAARATASAWRSGFTALTRERLQQARPPAP